MAKDTLQGADCERQRTDCTGQIAKGASQVTGCKMTAFTRGQRTHCKGQIARGKGQIARDKSQRAHRKGRFSTWQLVQDGKGHIAREGSQHGSLYKDREMANDTLQGADCERQRTDCTGQIAKSASQGTVCKMTAFTRGPRTHCKFVCFIA